MSTPPVGYSGSTSTVKETNCDKRKSLYIKYYDLHQLQSDVSHHDSLKEECHLLHCAGEIGSATCSPDSRCRRFLKDTAVRKSGRSRIGAFLPDLFKVRYHVILFCQFVHLYALLLSPTDCELEFTKDLVFEKTIVNTFEMFTWTVNSFAASLPRIPSHVVSSLYFGLAVSSIMRVKESIQS